MTDDLPDWAQRLRRERQVRGWTQADVVAAMRTFSDTPLPNGLLDQWKRWERGRNKPDEFYRPLIAATFGTVTESLFPTRTSTRRTATADEILIGRTGMDTHELVQRVRRSSVDTTTLDALSFTVEQLCCDYAKRDPYELISESREWLQQITGLLDERLTLTQHKDILDAAGWLSLLIGCLEYDTGQTTSAEATRVAALQLGDEAGHPAITGWAHEMRSWFALTGGHYRHVIAAAQAGQDAAPGRSVAVQLCAQEAKAWARMGNQRHTVKALETGRTLLDSLPLPERPENHFIVDPDKFDFYAMDCYRLIEDNELAEMHAQQIISNSTAHDGSLTSPMRAAEAEITLGIIAARRGSFEEAVRLGNHALSVSRRSRPSLLLVGSELDNALQRRYPNEPDTHDFHAALAAATSSGD